MVPSPGGRLNDDITLLRALGRGAMGEVWLAESHTFGTPIAVKLPAADADDSAVDRLIEEGRTAARIESAYAVRIFEQGFARDGTPYLAMEYLNGETLQERLEEHGPLLLDELARILEQVAEAIDEAHRLGIVHRDIKPHNIFLSDRGAKVVDFGSVRRGEASTAVRPQAEVFRRRKRMTAPDCVVGTPAYLSRDVLLDPTAIDAHVDLWALGVTAFKALTGTLPFRGEGIAHTCEAIIGGRMRRASKLRVGLQPGYDAWFARVFSHDRARRPRSAREMAEGFAALLRGAPQRRAWAPFLAAALVPCAVAASIAVLVSRAPRSAARFELPPPNLAAAITPALQAVGVGKHAHVAVDAAPPVKARRGPLAPEDLVVAARQARVEIGGGPFFMGCAEGDKECDRDEPAGHVVELPFFAIDRAEVAAVDYARCVEAGSCSGESVNGYALDGGPFVASNMCNYGVAVRARHPMNCVTFAEAAAYCAWMDARLPTEAQWEKAARGGTRARFPWGDEEPSCRLAVMAEGPQGCRANGTWPAGAKQAGASPLGVLGMADNVREWVGGSYAPGDPRRVARGGSWGNAVGRFLRVSEREPLDGATRSVHLGFRCVSD
jgi:formylglycine-generating enzyme required for sulfatase activity/predicted Ser/Thr protein kinase